MLFFSSREARNWLLENTKLIVFLFGLQLADLEVIVLKVMLYFCILYLCFHYFQTIFFWGWDS